MDIFCWIIGFLFTIWLLVSPLICLWWVSNPAEFFWRKHPYTSTIIWCGGFLGSLLIISLGSHYFLWFIPDAWLLENSIPFLSWFVSFIIGFFTISSLWAFLQKTCDEKRQRNYEEQHEHSIRQHLHVKMNCLSDPLKLDQTLAGFRQREKELDELRKENKLSIFEEEEMAAFDLVWNKENLRQIIDNLAEARKKLKLDAYGRKSYVELLKMLLEKLDEPELDELDELKALKGLKALEKLEEELNEENKSNPKDG